MSEPGDEPSDDRKEAEREFLWQWGGPVSIVVIVAAIFVQSDLGVLIIAACGVYLALLCAVVLWRRRRNPAD